MKCGLVSPYAWVNDVAWGRTVGVSQYGWGGCSRVRSDLGVCELSLQNQLGKFQPGCVVLEAEVGEVYSHNGDHQEEWSHGDVRTEEVGMADDEDDGNEDGYDCVVMVEWDVVVVAEDDVVEVGDADEEGEEDVGVGGKVVDGVVMVADDGDDGGGGDDVLLCLLDSSQVA